MFKNLLASLLAYAVCAVIMLPVLLVLPVMVFYALGFVTVNLLCLMFLGVIAAWEKSAGFVIASKSRAVPLHEKTPVSLRATLQVK